MSFPAEKKKEEEQIEDDFFTPPLIFQEKKQETALLAKDTESRNVHDDIEQGLLLSPRVKCSSDVTGMTTGGVPSPRSRRKNRRAISDMVLKMNLPPQHYHYRTRQLSSTDSITKLRDVPIFLNHADLRLAEEIQEHGTHSERLRVGVSESDHQRKMNEQVEYQKIETFASNKDGLSSEEAAKRLVQNGRNELPEKVDPKWLIFLRQFYAPMPIMIWLAIIIEIAISNYLDMGILMAIQFSNASISFYEINKAGNAVSALKSSLKPSATCKRDGEWAVINAALLVPGDTVLLGSGSAIPADCRVNSNSSEIDVDQAALTGESLPVTFYSGDSCKMGSTVVRGEVEATVEFTGATTFFGKTASLLANNKHEISHLQRILMTVMIVLVGLSLLLCVINFIYLVVEGVPVKEALSFTVVLLVASIPLAIEIVTTTTLAIGSKNLVKHGAIVSRLSAIEDLAGMSILCSDKTGTLTLNQMVLQDDTPVYANGQDQESVLLLAAMAAKWKEPPRDALDRLTLGAVNRKLLQRYEQIDYIPFDPQIKRTEGTVKDIRTGVVFKTSKGAPHIILGLLDPYDEVREAVERDIVRLGERGIRSLAVARSESETGIWKMMGLLTFLDPPRVDTKQTIVDARHYGVAVKMITGDHLLIARNTALQLDLGNRIFTAERLPMLDAETNMKPTNLSETYGDICLAADGFAQVYPEHKFLIVEALRELHYTVGMTGDGVNDAPALKRADIGIAVAGSTDAARAAADIVLTEPGLGTIVHGIKIAREIFSRISNFLMYRIAATLQLLLFFFIAIFAFHPADYEQPEELDNNEPWPEFFHMPVLMLMLITLLNDGTLITIAYDYAEASSTPNRWNLPALFVASSTLGAISCGSSLLLLSLLLDSWNPSSFLRFLGMDGVQYGQVITAIYLKVSVSDFLTLFSARTGPHFFYKAKPAPMLVLGAFFALLLSSLLALFWPESEQDGIQLKGLRGNTGLFMFVWLYCLVFWLIQDLMKVLAFRWMYETNFNNVSTKGVVVLPESALKLIEDLDNALAEEENTH